MPSRLRFQPQEMMYMVEQGSRGSEHRDNETSSSSQARRGCGGGNEGVMRAQRKEPLPEAGK